MVLPGALRTIDGYEAMHLIRKGRSGGCRRAMWSGNAGSFIPSLASLCNRDISLGKSLLFYSGHRRSFTAVSPYLQQIPPK